MRRIYEEQMDVRPYVKAAIDYFLRWCDDSYLQINVSKTKDMVIDFRRKALSQDDLTIKGQTIEQVTLYKYLGTVIDSTLNFGLN